MKIKRQALVIFFLFLCLAGFDPAWAESEIDLNTATEEELMVIDKVGPTTSRAIVEYRNVHGPFSSCQELTKISGLGPSFLKRNEPTLTTSDNLRCWNCGWVFSASKYSNFGTCPHCRKEWPQQPQSGKEKVGEAASPKTSPGELPIKVGDHKNRVIELMGEDYREAPSPIGGLDENKQELYGPKRLYYPEEGLYLDFIQDRLWKIEAVKPFSKSIFGVHLGDREGRVRSLIGLPDIDGKYLSYGSYRGNMVQFRLLSPEQKVDRIYVVDNLTQKKIDRLK